MTFHAPQLKSLIITPALQAINLWSESAVNLLMLTCAQESHLGTYFRQIGTVYKGGLGIYQMESNTYHDIWSRKVEKDVIIRTKIRLNCQYEGRPPDIRLITDLTLATIMCRLFYLCVKEPLPKQDDVIGLATYWKNHYNTELGKGTIEQAISNYTKLVLNV